MIQMQTKLVVADNTGAKEVAMIRRLGQHSRTAKVGDIIVVAVKTSTPDAAVKKGTVAKAVIVRTKAPIRRADGSYLRTRCPRASRQELYENSFTRTGGSITWLRVL